MVGAATLSLWLGPAGGGEVRAGAPELTGWWNVANTGLAGAAPPAPPNVPEGGLFVSGNALAATPPIETPVLPPPADVVPNPTEGQQAIAAVRFLLGDGGSVAGPLTLRVAGAAPAPPTTAIRACPLVLPSFSSGGNQPWPQRPAYDCAAGAVGGVVAADGKAITFDLGGLARDGLLVVALVPTGPSDQVAFEAPGDEALAVTAPGAATPPALAPETGAIAPDSGANGQVVAAPVVGGGPRAAPPESTPGPLPAPVAPGAGPSTRPSAPQPAAAVTETDDWADRLLTAFFGLAFLAALVAVYRQDSGRVPNLLGGRARRGGAGAGTAIAAEAPARGIGRFSRPRTGPVPKL